MNLAAGRQELADRGFDSLGATRAAMYLNHGKDALEGYFPFPWLLATAAGAAPLSISDLRSVLHVRDTARSNRPLWGTTEHWLVQSGYDLDQTGTASAWWIDGTTIRTNPVDSGASLSVRYAKFSPALSADGDSPLFDSRWDMNWIDLSAVEAYRDSDHQDDADRLLAAVDRRVQMVMIPAYASQNLQNPEEMVVYGESLDW